MASAITQPEIHEAANLFPLDEEHIGELAEDIRQHGQRVPIELFEGKVLDGRRRLLACRKVGVEPTFKTIEAADPIGYVVSLNLHRRQLTTSQRAMIAARVRAMFDKQAKERRKRKPKESVVVNSPQQNGKSRDHAGRMVKVSGQTVDRATKVLKSAEPEVVKAVDDGRMTVACAVALAEKPAEVQRQEAADPKPRRRSPATYGNAADPQSQPQPATGPIKVLGIGVIRANEAINSLTRIPKNDALRSSGLKLVADWIRRNK